MLFCINKSGNVVYFIFTAHLNSNNLHFNYSKPLVLSDGRITPNSPRKHCNVDGYTLLKTVI